MGMLPRESFEILHAVMAISVLFEQFSNRFCYIFFDPNFECFAKYDAFCLHIFDYACLRRKTYCYQRGWKLLKKYIGLHQKHF